MKTFSFILLFSTFFFSCTTMKLVNTDQINFYDLNAKHESDDVTIIKKNQEIIKGHDLKVTQDSTTLNGSTQNKLFIPTGQIKEIIFKDSWDGAVDGFTYGFLTGAGTGIIAVLAKDEGGNKGDTFPILASVIIGTAWGLAFGLVGLPVGAAIGHKYKYVFIAPSHPTSQNINTRNFSKSP